MPDPRPIPIVSGELVPRCVPEMVYKALHACCRDQLLVVIYVRLGRGGKRTSVARKERGKGERVAFLFHSGGVKSVGYNLLKNIPARTRPVEERIAPILAKIVLRISQLLRT